MAETFEFELYDAFGSEMEGVHEHLQTGSIPFDTLFRLGAIGCRELDPQVEEPQSLRRNMLKDIAAHGDDPARLRQDTYDVLFGPLPELVIDPMSYYNRDGYPTLDTMYYTLGDMAHAVQESRRERGVAVSNPSFKIYMSEKEWQWRTCVGDAQKIWRIIVQRTNPAAIDSPIDYYPPFFSFNQVYESGDRTMARRNVANSVISDTVVLKLYQESVETGIKGIAHVGQDILQLLLIEEHPELHEAAA